MARAGLVGHIVGPEGHVRNVSHAFVLKLVTFLMVSDVLIQILFFPKLPGTRMINFKRPLFDRLKPPLVSLFPRAERDAEGHCF